MSEYPGWDDLAELAKRVKALESAVTLTDMGWATAEPEPSPGKAERVGPEWTAEYAAKVIRREADDLLQLGKDWRSTKVVNIGPGLTAIVERLRDLADQIAAALNSTPDPKLTALVDACREVLWLFDDDGHQRPGERRLTARNIKNLRATYDVYLAGEGE